MKIELPTPNQNDLVWAYNLFHSGANIDLPVLLQIFSWSRYDPRLGQIIIEFLAHHWQMFNPVEVNTKLFAHPMALCWGILADHAQLRLPQSQRKLLASWRNCCLTGIAKGPLQTYFIGLHAFGGKLQREEAFDSIALYRRWGYLSKMPMIPLLRTAEKNHMTLLSKAFRKAKLTEFLRLHKTFTVQDYIAFHGGLVSLRIAEMDLKAWTTRRGNTKAARYYK